MIAELLTIPALTAPAFYAFVLTLTLGPWIGGRILRWLVEALERQQFAPLRQKEMARMIAVRATLRAIRRGLIRLPSVYR
jgi:hypothetical protein